MKSIRKKLRPLQGVSFALSMLVQLGGLIPLYCMPRIIDQWIPVGNLRQIYLSVFVFCGIPLLLAAVYVVYKLVLLVYTKKLSDDLRLQCFANLLHQPMAFFDEAHSAELARKCSQEASDYITIEAADKPKVWSNLCVCAALMVLLWRIHPLLAVGQLLYFPLMYPLMRVCGHKLEEYISQILTGNARRAKNMQEGFHAIRTLKAFQCEDVSVARLEETQRDIRRIWTKDVALENLMGGLSSSFLPSVFYGVTFVLSAVLVIRGDMTVGLLTAAIGYSSRMHALFHTLLSTFMNQKKAKTEAAVIERYLEMPDERQDAGERAWKFASEIRFEGVSFRYQETQEEILQNVSLCFPKGKWIGIHGESGVGKTTVLELLLRFYSCQSGVICVDGVDIRSIRLDEVRRNIGYVPQEPFLLEGSAMENLRLAAPTASEEKIRAVLSAVGLEAKFAGKRLYERIGEGGLNLSGGERQRITIAQCLLRGASVILLDEATSQLDDANQQKIQEIFHTLRDDGVTIISVAHRPQFNRGADVEYALTRQGGGNAGNSSGLERSPAM